MSSIQGFMTNRGYVNISNITCHVTDDNYLIIWDCELGKCWVKCRDDHEAFEYSQKINLEKNRMNNQQLQQMLGLRQAELGRIYHPGDLPSNLNENKKEKSKMGEMLNDVKNYVKEHRSVIYTVVLIVLADHFLLGGKMRHKLEALLNGALDKAQEKLNGTKAE